MPERPPELSEGPIRFSRPEYDTPATTLRRLASRWRFSSEQDCPWIYGATAQPACVTSLAGLPAEACRAKARAGIQPAASDVMAIMKPGAVILCPPDLAESPVELAGGILTVQPCNWRMLMRIM